MSEIKVNNIKGVSASTAAIALNSSDGTATANITGLTNGGTFSNRNVIINGAMHVNQRSSHGTAVTATGDNQYLTVDRFKWRNYGGSGLASFTQVIGDYPSSEHRFSLKATVTTVNTTEDQYDQAIAYRVEGYDWQRFGWGRSNPKSATISFWVKTSVAGVYSVSMRSGDGSRSQVKETPSLSADTWTKVKLTFTGDTDTAWVGSDYATNGAGCLIEWNVGKSNSKNTSTLGSWIAGNKVASDNQARWIATSGATFFLTGVQVEVGDVATDFEHITLAETKVRCMRYFQKAGARHCGATEGTTQFRILTPLEPEMRASPTVTVRSGGKFNTRYAGDTTITNPTLSSPRAEARGIWTGISTSGRTAGIPIYGRMQQGDVGDFLSCDAEL